MKTPESTSESTSATDSDDNNLIKCKRGKVVPCFTNNSDVTARADVIPLFDPETSELFSNQ